MCFTVINCDNLLHIIDEESFPVCRIDYNTLQEVMYQDGAVCSASILHLAARQTLPTYILYQIASIIQKKFSHLQIDWFSTFYHVERNNYLSTSFQMKELLENNDFSSEADAMKSFIEFEKNDPVENIDTILLRIAMMNIINYRVQIR